MDTALFTWYQVLQLLALGPCLFIVFFLCVTARNLSKIIVPVLYFLSLSCHFLAPVSDAIGGNSLQGMLVFGKSLTPAMSFLLIIEFITGNVPALIYWTVLAIPLIGGSSINYVAMIANGEICIHGNVCTEPAIFKQFYDIFSSSLIFLLTVVLYNRLSQVSEKSLAESESQKQSKYAIIFSLISLNLVILALKLAFISGHVTFERVEFAATVVRLGFIYLVLTYVFRVFDGQIEIAYERVPSIHHPTERDMALADNVRKLLSEEKVYRIMELSREMLAKKLAVTENQLSRVINHFFSQNFNMLINGYRIEEAKERLANEATAITTIAFDVGFNSIPSFNRVFKNSTGLSPTEYRSSKQSSQDVA